MSTLKRSIRVTASRRRPSPNISSVTADHDDSCELPASEGGGSPNQCCGHSPTRTSANTGIPARTPPLQLPRQPTTAELGVVNLIAQHDPETNPQLPRRRDAGFREPFLHDLPSLETLPGRIPSRGMCGRLAPEKPQEWIPLFAERSESLPYAARVLARDHADVARECLPVEKPCGIADEDLGRQRRDGAHARLGHEQRRSSPLVGYARFQAANNTAVMTNIRPDQRGVISGMLNLSRNLGLITGASVMGAVFALASATIDITTARPEAIATGMRITFAVAAILILVALTIAVGTYRRAAVCAARRAA